MNAGLATKAGKALILASTMTLALQAAASASTASAAVPLGSQGTLSLSSLYLNPPSGAVTLNTLPFQVGNAWQLGFGQSATVPAAFATPQSVAVLVNTQNTYSWYECDTAGQVILTFSDGSTQTTNLVVEENVRDWVLDSAFAVNTLNDPLCSSQPATTTQAWSGSSVSGQTATIDMLTIPVQPTTANLVSVTVTNSNTCCDPNVVMVSGISVTYDPATTTTVRRPGNSANTPALTNSNATGHSANSWVFTGVSPSKGNTTGGTKAQSIKS